MKEKEIADLEILPVYKVPAAQCAISECELFIDGRSKAVDVIKVAGWI